MKLKDLSLGVKIAFLWFYLLSVLGFFFAFLIVEYTVGHIPMENFLQRLVDYYKGNPEGMMFGKSNLEIAEISHFHSFISAVVLFIISFFFSYSNMKSNIKIAVINLTFFGILIFVLSPWIVKFLPSLAFLKPLSSLLFVPGTLFMGIKVLKDMFL